MEVNREGESRLIKRLRRLLEIPGTLLVITATVGDFFSPKGGWGVVLILGIIAILLGLYFLIVMSMKGQDFRNGFCYRKTVSEEAIKEWGSPDVIWNCKNPWSSHGVHALLLFGICAVFLANKSYASANEGGVLAKNFSMVEAVQKQIGISEEMLAVSKETLAEQRKANQHLTEIEGNTAKTKLEISDDPLKELTNLGVDWYDDKRLAHAIEVGDLRITSLFMQSKKPISVDAIKAAYKSPNPEFIELLIANKELFDPKKCRDLLNTAEDYSSVQNEKFGRAMSAYCSTPEFREFLNKSLKQANERYEREKAAYYTEQAKRKSVPQCVKEELINNGEDLMEEASSFNVLAVHTMTPRQQMLAEVNRKLMFGTTNFKAEVEKYCEQQAASKPSYDDAEYQAAVKALKKLMSLVS